ncbi:MAG: hypothetical protein ACI9EW_001846 [Cellvibrionaceae bacterium]|jgi:hypothetical protein
MISIKKQTALLTKIKWPDWLLAGFVLILVGYFLPWFKHSAAGLTLIGLDISEWLKFMPQFSSGELSNRNYFYLPPITLGGMVVLWSLLGRLDQWRGWLTATAGCVIALIAFPSLEALRFENSSEWRFRLILIGLVFALALARPLISRVSQPVIMSGIVLLALIGSLLPARLLYLSRSAYIFWLRLTPNPGLGFGLHLLGTLFVLWAAWLFWKNRGQIA